VVRKLNALPMETALTSAYVVQQSKLFLQQQQQHNRKSDADVLLKETFWKSHK